MKRDWTKRQMRLSPASFASDFVSFLLFLRLGLVALLCFPGTAVITARCGPTIGIVSCLVAFLLWWYHFGLPNLKELRSGFNFFSADFCLFGYLFTSAVLVVAVLEFFGVITEGKPLL